MMHIPLSPGLQLTIGGSNAVLLENSFEISRWKLSYSVSDPCQPLVIGENICFQAGKKVFILLKDDIEVLLNLKQKEPFQMYTSNNKLYVIDENQLSYFDGRIRRVREIEETQFFQFCDRPFALQNGALCSISGDQFKVIAQNEDLQQVKLVNYSNVLITNAREKLWYVFNCVTGQLIRVDSTIMQQFARDGSFAQAMQCTQEQISTFYKWTTSNGYQTAVQRFLQFANQRKRVVTTKISETNVNTKIVVQKQSIQHVYEKLPDHVDTQGCVVIPLLNEDGTICYSIITKLNIKIIDQQQIIYEKQIRGFIPHSYMIQDYVVSNQNTYFLSINQIYQINGLQCNASTRVQKKCNDVGNLCSINDKLYIQTEQDDIYEYQNRNLNQSVNFTHLTKISQVYVKFMWFQFCDTIIQLEVYVSSFSTKYKCKIQQLDIFTPKDILLCEFERVVAFLAGVLVIQSSENQWILVDLLSAKVVKLSQFNNLDSKVELHLCGLSLSKIMLQQWYGIQYIQQRDKLWHDWFLHNGLCKQLVIFKINNRIKLQAQSQIKIGQQWSIIFQQLNEPGRLLRLKLLRSIFEKFCLVALYRESIPLHNLKRCAEQYEDFCQLCHRLLPPKDIDKRAMLIQKREKIQLRKQELKVKIQLLTQENQQLKQLRK